jgi:outer membrane receptor protein involved in Fe transport
MKISGMYVACSLATLFAWAALATCGLCQGVSGSFSGTITDTTGAVIPGASVTITNVGTGVTQTTITNARGVYEFPTVKPGTYDIAAVFKGFSTVVRHNQILYVNQAGTVDITLRPGAVTQTVEVAGEVPLINTTNSTVGSVVESTQVVNLPLNGRQFTQLILLTPGASPKSSSQQGSFEVGHTMGAVSPAVNGIRPDQNNFTVDGVENNELFFNDVALSPPPDAIQEFKVQTVMSSGAYGRSPGANVNIVTKSGTNEVHGSVWEFLRNDKLDSRNTFNPSISKFRQNQFGATLGGPIIKNKLWAFGWYEGFRKSLGSTGLAIVPTPAQLNGDLSAFPQQIYNPFTTHQTGTDAQGNPIFSRDPFSGNMISSNLINPTTIALANKLYPQPNILGAAVGSPNFLNNEPDTTTTNQYSTRADVSLSHQMLLYGRWTWFKGTVGSPAGLPNRYANTSNANYEFVTGLTKTFNPTTVGNFHFQYLHTDIGLFRDCLPSNFLTTINVNVDFPPGEGVNLCEPGIGISDLTGLPGSLQIPIGPIDNWEWNGDINKVVGNHTFSMGGAAIKSTMFSTNGYASAGFDETGTNDPQNPTTTGSGFASFLLGVPASASREAGNGGQTLFGWIYSGWMNDQWKTTPKLTLTFGLRYDYAQPLRDLTGKVAAPDWNESSPGHIIWRVSSRALDYPKEILTPTHTLQSSGIFAVVPSAPALYAPDRNNFSPRFGMAWELPSGIVLRGGYGIFYDFNQTQFQMADDIMGNWPFGLPDFTPPDLNNPTVANPTPVHLMGGTVFPPVTLSATPPTDVGFAAIIHSPTPYVQEWNLGIQKELPSNWALTLEYVGSKGTKLANEFIVNTASTPGPGPIDPRRRLPELGTIRMDPRWFNSSFHAGEAKLEHRAAHGLTTMLSYTYSKVMDVADCGHCGNNPQNPFNFQAERAPAGFDLTHNFVSSWVYELPFGRGRQYLSSANWFTNGVLGGWQASGIVSLQTGFPFNITVSPDIANIGSGSQRPWVTSISTLKQQGPDRQLQFFNPSALFTVPYTFGNLGRNVLRSDSYEDVDFGLAKRWGIPPSWLRGHENTNIEFRGEFFNTFNHPNLDAPVSRFGRSDIGRVEGIRGSPRDIQFALKVNF